LPRLLSLLSLAVFLVVSSLACSTGGRDARAEGDDQRLRVVATTGMVADIVRAVAGERVIVHQMMGAGVDPHLYTPTRNDMAAILDADLVFTNGLRLEGRLGDALRGVGGVVPVAERIPVQAMVADDGESDPHVWMHVERWAKGVEVVRQALAQERPEFADEFAERAEQYRAELVALEQYIRDVAATVPSGRRVLVTAHDAFGYFGEAYGFEVIGIQGMSTESEAGLTEINRLVDRIVRDEIPAVFVESTISDRNVRALIEGARSRGHEVRIGGTLFSDATGPAGTWEGTYIGMLDHNASTVARSLGGSVPEGGFRAWKEATLYREYEMGSLTQEATSL